MPAIHLHAGEASGDLLPGPGAAAGAALKKSVLELGGSDPFIVLDDADLDSAAQAAVEPRFLNAGQTCVAAKRVIAVEAIADDLTAKMLERIRALSVGDRLSFETDMGPLARNDLRTNLTRHVDQSVAAGAQVLLEGGSSDGRGWFFTPTVLTGVSGTMPVIAEEDRARALTGSLESGSVFINAKTISDPSLPFGGIKQSGYGRELSSWGIHEFTNVQAVSVGDPHPA